MSAVPAYASRTFHGVFGEGDFSINFTNILHQVRASIKKVADVAFRTFSDTLLVTKEILNDSGNAGTVIRKISKDLLIFVEMYRSTPGFFDKLREGVKDMGGFMDVVLVAADANYFLKGSFVEDTKSYVAARLAMVVADVGGALLWFEEMGFFDLTKVAQSLGEVRLFKYVPAIVEHIPVIKNMEIAQHVAESLGEVKIFSVLTKISLEKVVNSSVCLVFGFLTLDAFLKMQDTSEAHKYLKTVLGIDSAYYAAELALTLAAFVGVTNVFGLGVLAASCVGLCVGKVVYSVIHKEQLANDKEAQRILREQAVHGG